VFGEVREESEGHAQTGTSGTLVPLIAGTAMPLRQLQPKPMQGLPDFIDAFIFQAGVAN
jgi:hypothetical protein